MKSSHLLALLLGGIVLKLFLVQPTYCPFGSIEQRVKADLEQLHRCMQRYHAREAKAPTSWAELKDLGARFGFEFTENDPWENPYMAQISFTGARMRVGTLGRDGVLGGSRDDSDRWFDFELGSWRIYDSASDSVRP